MGPTAEKFPIVFRRPSCERQADCFILKEIYEPTIRLFYAAREQGRAAAENHY